MLENEESIRLLVRSVKKYFENEKKSDICEVLDEDTCTAVETGYDNWNGGIYLYSLHVKVPVDKYQQIEQSIDSLENEILRVGKAFLRGQDSEVLEKVVILPLLETTYPLVVSLPGVDFSELRNCIIQQSKMLIDVAVGDSRIDDVNDEYMSNYRLINSQLEKLGIKHTNKFTNLWEWYEYWKENQLTTYASRRAFVSKLFEPILSIMDTASSEGLMNYELTGWNEIDRDVMNMASLLTGNPTDSVYSVVGHMARATMIKIGHEVYDYVGIDKEIGKKPGFDDSKRILSNFVSTVLPGSSNESIRKYVRAAIELTLSVDHNQKPSLRDAKLCYLSASTVAQIIKLLEKDYEIPY